MTSGEGADVVIDAVGMSDTILQTMDLARAGGRILLAELSAERYRYRTADILDETVIEGRYH